MSDSAHKSGQDFQQLQKQFAAHLRDPQRNPAPAGIEERRLAIYRDLFYNNINSFLGNGFPVLRSLFNDQNWHALVRDFFSRHASQTPYFLEIAREFLHYLQHERTAQPQDLPFMLELAHYEWLELAVDVDPDEIDPAGCDPRGDLLDGRPALSPLAHVAAYSYPVHRICRDFQPLQPEAQPVWLIVYRNAEDRVRFMEISAATARLLELLQDSSLRGQDAILQLQAELPGVPADVVRKGALQALQHLWESGVILGTSITERPAAVL